MSAKDLRHATPADASRDHIQSSSPSRDTKLRQRVCVTHGTLGSARPTGEFLHRLLLVLVLLAHDRRRIRHVAVTAHPTVAWTAHQLREAFPWDQAPRYVIHDQAFDGLGATAQAMGIEGMLTVRHKLRKALTGEWERRRLLTAVGNTPLAVEAQAVSE